MSIRQLKLIMFISLVAGHGFASEAKKDYFEKQYESRCSRFIANPQETEEICIITDAVNEIFAKPPRKSLSDGTPTYAKESQMKVILKLMTGTALIHENPREIPFPELEDQNDSHYSSLYHMHNFSYDLVKYFDLANKVRSVDKVPDEIWLNHAILTSVIGKEKALLLSWFNEALRDHKAGVLKRQESIKTIQGAVKNYLASKSYLLLDNKTPREAESPTSDVTDVSRHTDSSLDLSIVISTAERGRKDSSDDDTPLSTTTTLSNDWEMLEEEIS